MQKFLLFFLLFNALYGPRLKIVDLMLLFTLILSILYIVQSIIVGKLYGSNKALFSLLFLIFLSSLHYLYTNFAEISLLDLTVKMLLYYLSASFLIYWYDKLYKNNFYTILRHIIYATFINSVFVILAFFSNPFKNLVSNYLNYESQLNWIDTQRRIFDMSLGGGATASFTFGLVFIIGLALPKAQKPFFYYLLMLFIALATSFMGRSGVYLIVLYLFFIVFKNIFNQNISNLLKYSIYGAFVYFILLFCNFNNITNSEYFLWLTQGGGDNENSTMRVLSDMWLFPKENLLLGDGYFGRIPPNIIYSDIGYVRVLHAVGIFGSVILYGWMIYIVYISKSKITSLWSPNLNNLFAVIIFLNLIMNLKELHFASRGTSLIIFLILLFFVKYRKVEFNNI